MTPARTRDHERIRPARDREARVRRHGQGRSFPAPGRRRRPMRTGTGRVCGRTAPVVAALALISGCAAAIRSPTETLRSKRGRAAPPSRCRPTGRPTCQLLVDGRRAVPAARQTARSAHGSGGVGRLSPGGGLRGVEDRQVLRVDARRLRSGRSRGRGLRCRGTCPTASRDTGRAGVPPIRINAGRHRKTTRLVRPVAGRARRRGTGTLFVRTPNPLTIGLQCAREP